MADITVYTLTCEPDGSFWFVYESGDTAVAFIGAGATALAAEDSAMDVLLGDAWQAAQELAFEVSYPTALAVGICPTVDFTLEESISLSRGRTSG